MVALIFLLLNLVASIFKSKGRLEAENAALRHPLSVLQRKKRGRVREQRSPVLYPALSRVSVDPQGHHDHPPRDPGALANVGKELDIM